MHFLLISSLFLTVHSLAIEQRSCITPDVITVSQQVTHPHYFCAWYLEDARTNSPITKMSAKALSTACQCIVSVEPLESKEKNLATIANAARLQSFIPALCPSIPANPISKEFQSPSSFCTFFGSFERRDSPIPDLNVPAVRKACKCILEVPKSSAKISSTKKPFTTSQKSASELTSKLSSKSTARSSLKALTTTTYKSASTTELSLKSSSSVTSRSSSKLISIKASSTKILSSTRPSSASISLRPTSARVLTSKSTLTKIPSSSLRSSNRSSSRLTSSSRTSSSLLTSSSRSSSLASGSRSSTSSSRSLATPHPKSSTTSSRSTILVPVIPSSSSRSTTSKSSSASLASTIDAYDLITSLSLQTFCTSYLGYTTPLVTKTATSYANDTERTTSIEITTSTEIVVSTATEVVETITVTSEVRTTVDAGATARKRALETPSVLTSYPESAIDSGCRRAASPPATQTMSETALITSTETVLTITTTTVFETASSVLMELATSTSTAIVPIYTDAPCGNQPYGSLWTGTGGATWNLYCNNYQISGTIVYQKVAPWVHCLQICGYYQACQGVSWQNNYCLILGAVSTDSLSLAPGNNAAILVDA